MRLWVAVSHSLILGSPGFYIGEASHKDLRNICLNTETHLFFFYIVSFLELSSQLNSILLTFCKLDLFSVMVFKNALFSLFTYGLLTASEPCPPPPNYYFSWWKVSHFYQKEPKVSVSGGCTHVKASVFGTKYFPFVPDFQWKIFANVSVTLTLFSYQQRSASEKNVPFYRFSFSFIHLMFVSFYQKTMDWHSPLFTCSWLYISMAAPLLIPPPPSHHHHQADICGSEWNRSADEKFPHRVK